MEKKRKLLARGAARSEAGSSKKSRTSTPPEARAPTPQPRAAEPEPLPTSISSGRPLPTLPQHQPGSLPSSQYQSVAESGVMAESLERSRKKWINESIFEKYWTKPSKKKGISNESADNPPKDTMTKLGPCTITIEPHIFEVVMYAIKDTSRTTQPLPQPMYRPPIIQYGPQPQPASSQHQTQYSNTPAGSQGIRPQENHSQSHGSLPPSASNGNGLPLIGPNSAPSHQPPNPPTPQQTSMPTPPVAAATIPGSPSEPSPAPAKSSDPVIQMLAERAATDQELKALMRIVADGKATPEELRKFQGHIDELTKHVNMRLSSATDKPPPTQAPPSAQATNTYTNQSPAPIINGRPPLPAAAQNGRPMQHMPLQHGNSGQQFSPQPQALRSKGPLPPTKPDISAICFEFVGGSGDRFLFPKYSILEFGPGNSVIASFLIVRKGSSADAPAYDPKLDYYQPVTIRLYAQQSRQLDNLPKVVAPQDEVRKYMDDIMDNMTRAEYVLLAMQLRREEERTQGPEDVPAQNGYNNGNGVLWTTPASHAPMPHNPVKRPVIDGEQHHKFMGSYS